MEQMNLQRAKRERVKVGNLIFGQLIQRRALKLFQQVVNKLHFSKEEEIDLMVISNNFLTFFPRLNEAWRF